jgi:hypothetical protein
MSLCNESRNIMLSRGHHRLNRDGSYDSICLKCFATVANTRTEIELTALNKIRACNHTMLCDRRLFRAPHSKFTAQ